MTEGRYGTPGLAPYSSAANGAANMSAWNMVKRVPPEKFSFDAGNVLTGVLTDFSRTAVRDQKTGQPRMAVRYTVKEIESGKSVFFFGTHMLDSLLCPTDVGRVIEIRCTGADQAAGRNGNAMKTFDVLVSDGFAPGWANDGTPITDNDLPPTSSYS